MTMRQDITMGDLLIAQARLARTKYLVFEMNRAKKSGDKELEAFYREEFDEIGRQMLIEEGVEPSVVDYLYHSKL